MPTALIFSSIITTRIIQGLIGCIRYRDSGNYHSRYGTAECMELFGYISLWPHNNKRRIG
jgi:hypothetical protein